MSNGFPFALCLLRKPPATEVAGVEVEGEGVGQPERGPAME